MVIAALFLAQPAVAAGEHTRMDIAPAAPSERTLIGLGGFAIKMETDDIVLGAADRDSAYFPTFASSPTAGGYTVAGNVRATLSLSMDIGDALGDYAGRVGLPLGHWLRQTQAALSLSPGGKVSLAIGSNFGFARPGIGGPIQFSSHLSLNMDVLNPAKHTLLTWRCSF